MTVKGTAHCTTRMMTDADEEEQSMTRTQRRSPPSQPVSACCKESCVPCTVGGLMEEGDKGREL